MTDQDRAELIMLAKAYIALQPGSDLALIDKLDELGHGNLARLHTPPKCLFGHCLLVFDIVSVGPEAAIAYWNRIGG